jgi:serine/threonine protein kinase
LFCLRGDVPTSVETASKGFINYAEMTAELLLESCCDSVGSGSVIKFLKDSSADIRNSVAKKVLSNPRLLTSAIGVGVLKYFCDLNDPNIDLLIMQYFNSYLFSSLDSFDLFMGSLQSFFLRFDEKQIIQMISVHVNDILSHDNGPRLLNMIDGFFPANDLVIDLLGTCIKEKLETLVPTEIGDLILMSLKQRDEEAYYQAVSKAVVGKLFALGQDETYHPLLIDLFASKRDYKKICLERFRLIDSLPQLLSTPSGYLFLKMFANYLSHKDLEKFSSDWSDLQMLAEGCPFFPAFSRFMKMVSPRTPEYRDMLSKLYGYIGMTGSVTSQANINSAQKQLEFDRVGYEQIINEFLQTNNSSFERIIEEYQPLFEKYKSKVVVANLNKPGNERQSVHVALNELFTKLIIPMLEDRVGISNTFDLLYESQTSTIDTTDKACRKRPDFSVILKDNNCNIFPTFYSIVLPVEAKKNENEKDMINALRQSVSYLLDKFRSQLELLRTDPATDIFGYAIGTNGFMLNLAKAEIVANKVKIVGCAASQAKLCSSDGFNPGSTLGHGSTLGQFPGLVVLLALLSFGPTALGHVSHTNSFEIARLTAKKILGTGSFGTAILATWQNPNDNSSQFTALKLSRFTKIDGVQFSSYENRYQKEKAMLQTLSNIPLRRVQALVPHVIESFDSHCGLLFAEVGMSLVDFLAEFHQNKNTRYDFADALRKTLQVLCTDIFNETKITHRDIRPPNIIMKYNTSSISGNTNATTTPSSSSSSSSFSANANPQESHSFQSSCSIMAKGLKNRSSTSSSSSSASNQTGGAIKPIASDFSIVLIDWGIADIEGKPYRAHYSYDFADNFIVERCMNGEQNEIPEIDYRLDYDLSSIDYLFTAVKYQETDLRAPWAAGDTITKQDVLPYRQKMMESASKSKNTALWRPPQCQV